MKTTVFNLIILDESGSMSPMTQQTISGCNETLNTIRYAAQKNAETIRNLVSIYAFQDGGPVKSRYLVKNLDPKDVKDITSNDYEPWGNTPLLDAVGSTLTELKAIASTHEDASGIVTIMTDGYENSSTQYTWKQVANLISQLREMGWTINLIGANVDVDAMAAKMNIANENSMAYQQTSEGTQEMWGKFSRSVNARIAEEAQITACCSAPNERRESRKKSARGFFKR
ncbi:MAG: VWA domain-containing protein [Muribaculaceae bacterium]|nr:VWA domain-containing protein [Muribaculaceae bacterium]